MMHYDVMLMTWSTFVVFYNKLYFQLSQSVLLHLAENNPDCCPESSSWTSQEDSMLHYKGQIVKTDIRQENKLSFM